MKFNVKSAFRQWILAASVSIVSLFVGIRIATHPQQVAVKQGVHYFFVDDKPKPCLSC
jgi:hypothetical protein